MSDSEETAVPHEDLPPALRRLTFVDRLLRFVAEAIPTVTVMLALSPLLEPMPTEMFLIVTAVLACIAGAACAAWGDRFLVSFLRAIGRLA